MDVQVLAHARQVDQGLGDLSRAFDRRSRSRQRQAVAAQGDAHAEAPRELEQVRVVHAGQRQRIHAFHGQSMDDVVTHAEAPP